MIRDFDFIKELNFQEIEDCKKSSVNKELKEIYYTKCLLRDYLTNFSDDDYSLYHPDMTIQNFIKDFTFIASGAYGSVYSFNLDDTKFKAIYKTYADDGLIEYMSGLALNRLVDKTPNFMHTYAGIICSPNIYEESIEGLCEDEDRNYLQRIFFFEWIEGETLTKWLENHPQKGLDKDLINILSQVFFSLIIANTYFDFTHNDLHTSNILVKTLENPIEIGYNLPAPFGKIKIRTNYLVKIIDYGETEINKEKVINYIKTGIITENTSTEYMKDIKKLLGDIKNRGLEKIEIDKDNFIKEWIKFI